MGWVKAGMLAVLSAWVLESYLWTLRHDMPPSYMLAQQQFRLMEWGILAEPLPEMVEIPLPVDEIQVGELDQAVGESVTRQLQTQGLLAALNIGYPPTTAKLTQPYALGRYEVTYTQYDYYVWTQRDAAQPPAYPGSPPNEKNRGQRAVVNVSWDDAQGYLQWLSEKTKEEYGLPTEAEWEWAARGGTTSGYWWGDEVGVNNANCVGCGSQWENKHVAPVGRFPANAYSLHDTAGNVWEWTCSEWVLNLMARKPLCGCRDWSGARVTRWFVGLLCGCLRAARAELEQRRHIRGTYYGFRVFRASRTR
ncbi:MAG: SUMF1/EgtB/PvdO family nonheme iron enzyme [Thiolinea sp.]